MDSWNRMSYWNKLKTKNNFDYYALFSQINIHSVFSFATLIALGPRSPSSTSKVTWSFSFKTTPDCSPDWCTKYSLPSSDAINPNPLITLKNLTFPFIFIPPHKSFLTVLTVRTNLFSFVYQKPLLTQSTIPN